MASSLPRICIVTPTFNSEMYLEQTIISIVSQAGSYDLDYHVQDGGSSDNTIAILEKWQKIIGSGTFSTFDRNIVFTYQSKPDNGMYEAINSGFSFCNCAPTDIMAWLGSDDVLQPGALSTILSLLKNFPQIEFLGGSHALIDAEGILCGRSPALPYSSLLMRAGLYDGRTQPFIMQEGTFWRASLWQKVDGLNGKFKLAGDWDLWRQFAWFADFYSVDLVIAFHRRRHGQLSSVMENYYAEIDSDLGAGCRVSRDHILQTKEEIDRSQCWGYIISKYNDGWNIKREFALPAEARTPAILSPGFKLDGLTQSKVIFEEWRWPVKILSGVKMCEGPYPEFAIPGGVRWMQDDHIVAAVHVPRRGQYLMTFLFRASHAGSRFQIKVRNKTIFEFRLIHRLVDIKRDNVLRIVATLEKGENAISLVSDSTPFDFQSTRLLIVSWYFEKMPVMRKSSRKKLPRMINSVSRKLKGSLKIS